MKVVILAGGKGTRLADEADPAPKVMTEIGGRPVLWHIVERYAHHGFSEIFVALGHKGHVVRRYFAELFSESPCLSLDFAKGTATASPPARPGHLDVSLHLVDTGEDTATGGRLHRLRRWLDAEPFMVTYGDGVSDIDLAALLAFHRAHGRTATLSAVAPPSRFGRLALDGDVVSRFAEKPALHDWVSAGFFVFEPAVFELLSGDRVSLEEDVLPRLAATSQLAAYRHTGFWQCMDTPYERRLLQDLWNSGSAPWRVQAD